MTTTLPEKPATASPPDPPAHLSPRTPISPHEEAMALAHHWEPPAPVAASLAQAQGSDSVGRWIKDRLLQLLASARASVALILTGLLLLAASVGVAGNGNWAEVGEAIDLLEKITAEPKGEWPPLFSAIADGTFGLMKRPPEGGRGLDGVARKSETYVNPATEALDGVA